MFIVTITADAPAIESFYARIIGLDQQGWSEEEDGDRVLLHVHFSAEAAAAQCRDAFPGSRLQHVEERNWAQEWQSQWRPIAVGRRFFLAPSWSADETPAGRIRLEMRPGLVFGGGDHPTTQMCLELLEQTVCAGGRMADIGCGTAILAQGALALGASIAVGCDIDPAAVDAAIESGVPVFEGSVDALRSSSFSLLAANLPTGILMTLMPEFARILMDDGRAVMSGFLAEQRDMVAAEAAAHGFRAGAELSSEDWRACVFVKGRR